MWALFSTLNMDANNFVRHGWIKKKKICARPSNSIKSNDSPLAYKHYLTSFEPS